MGEPKGKMDSLAPFAASEVKASVSMFDGRRSPIRSHSLPQPYLMHPPAHHVGAVHHLSPKAVFDPSHYTQVRRICIYLSVTPCNSIGSLLVTVNSYHFLRGSRNLTISDSSAAILHMDFDPGWRWLFFVSRRSSSLKRSYSAHTRN
jgi:hypothetical protein